jgi:predicted nucleic acid-binding protein
MPSKIALNDVAGWQAMLDEALEQTGGALTKKETEWADRVLGAGDSEEGATAEASVKGVTLDAGALIALDRNDRRVIALVARAMLTGARVTVPACALAQALRRPAQQARLAKLVRQPSTDLRALDGPAATSVGILLAATRTADIADAHVVVCARRAGQVVVTSDGTGYTAT